MSKSTSVALSQSKVIRLTECVTDARELLFNPFTKAKGGVGGRGIFSPSVSSPPPKKKPRQK